jgi:hypothetical protein
MPAYVSKENIMEKSQSGTGIAAAVVDVSNTQQGATTGNTTGTTATGTTEVHEMAGNKVVNFVKHVLHEGNVNHIQISRQDGKVLWGISLTAGIATTAAVTLLLPALTGLSLIVLMVTHMRVEVVRNVEGAAETAGTNG